MEEWKDICGFEGYYQISSAGRVRSLDRYARVCGGGKRLVKGKILKPIRCTNGYLEISLNKGGERRVFLVHRLVANHFIENKSNFPEVNHKDEVIDNNCVENLEWCTSKYNANYGTRNERMMIGRETKPINQFHINGKLIKRWDCMMDACREYGADVSSMIRVCKGKQKTCKGFKWEYAEGEP